MNIHINFIFIGIMTIAIKQGTTGHQKGADPHTEISVYLLVINHSYF